MTISLRSLALLVPLLLTACTAQVIGSTSGINGSGGGNGSGGNGSGGSNGQGGTGGVAQVAVAMTRAQSDVLWTQYWADHGEPGSSSSSGGNDLDPNDLFLRVSDLGATCDSPTTELSCGGHWNLTLVLPPAFQAVGTYQLDDPALVQYSIITETGDPIGGSPTECSGGGGSLGAGTVEILSIDATLVRFRLTMSDPLSSSDPSGEYTAPRCP